MAAANYGTPGLWTSGQTMDPQRFCWFVRLGFEYAVSIVEERERHRRLHQYRVKPKASPPTNKEPGATVLGERPALFLRSALKVCSFVAQSISGKASLASSRRIIDIFLTIPILVWAPPANNSFKYLNN